MTTFATLQRLLDESLKEHAVLGEEIDALRVALASVPGAAEHRQRGKRENGAPKLDRGGPTRTEMLAKLVRDAGRTGLTRQEAISEMAKLCDSPPASVAQMLTNLRISGLIAPHEDGHWRTKR